MTDTQPAVALLFDDSELGGQLRDALHERGARIVHEGALAGLSRDLLQEVGADVLVVNLDDDADDALDSLYDMIDGDRPRVVFNDAQASRALTGWDRARWARHLAVKVLAIGDIDPPRPEDAREVQVTLAPAAPAADPVPVEALGRDALEETDFDLAADAETDFSDLAIDAVTEEDLAALAMDEPPQADPILELAPDLAINAPAQRDMADDASFDADSGTVVDTGFDMGEPSGDPAMDAESDSLAAELEALLASGELPDEEGNDAVGSGLRFSGDEDLPPLHDGDFGAAQWAGPDADADVELADPAGSAEVADLSWPTLTEPVDEPAAAPAPAAPKTVQAPDNWALLDDEAPLEGTDEPAASAFGIEKLSAAEFLAPDVEQVAADLEPTMSLELVSLEEAVAPQAFVPEHEMMLDELGSALSRIVLLGAAVDGIDSVCSFLDALPRGTRLTFLLTQHLGSQTEREVLDRLAGHGPLPLRLVEAGTRAGMGEVLMVPAGQQVRLRRDGSVEMLADSAEEPSIDATLSMAANGFGRDAVAIVFAGRGNDAIAGSQAIHDRGGQVWVESSSGEHFADMVSGIFAERLVSFSGTPSELAAHLIEVFP